MGEGMQPRERRSQYGGRDSGGGRIVVESGAVQRRRDGRRWKTWASRLWSSPRRPPPALPSLTSETRPPSRRCPTSRPRTSPSWNASSVLLPLLLLLVVVDIVQASTRRRSTGGIRRTALASPPPRSTTAAAAAGEAHAEGSVAHIIQNLIYIMCVYENV